jgi:type III pantothenate kinase
MILEVDIGNTRSKWRLVREHQVVHRSGVCRIEDIAQEALSGLCRDEFPSRARISCVRSVLVRQQFEDMMASHGISAEFAKSTSFCAGVANGYSDPAKLGVDRWLAVIAGYAEVQGPLCVLDCGSAITLDFVDQDGRHLGGYIAPGIRLMRQSLMSATDNVHFADFFGHGCISPGRDTTMAVSRGVQLAAIGLVEAALSRCDHDARGASLLITGGDADFVAPHLHRSAVLRPALVLDGLRLALP